MLLIIESFEKYSDLITRFTKSDTVSNNYMFPDEVRILISEGRLYSCHDAENCYIILKNPGNVKRVYYYINDFFLIPEFFGQDSWVTEILFRGSKGVPNAEIEFFRKTSFEVNLRRDQYSALLSSIPPCDPEYARSFQDAVKAVELFNSSFDIYSGDFIPRENTQELFDNGSLLCVYSDDGVLKGCLHMTLNGKNAWVSHLVVNSQYRGKGIASRLMDMFMFRASELGAKRVMLWVQHENEKAISLYEKYGFKYMNKSTISLVKDNGRTS